MTSMPCKVCQKNTSSKCGRCKGEYYCSKECQRSDWKFHKSFCPKIAAYVEKLERREKSAEKDEDYELDKAMEDM